LAVDLGLEYSDGSIKIHIGDYDGEINLFPSVEMVSKYTIGIPGRFEVKALIPPTPGFFVKKNDIIDYLAECLSSSHDYQTGNTKFDHMHFVKVDNIEWAQEHFDEQVIECLSSIMSSSFDRVYVSGCELKADKFIKTFDDCPSREDIETTIKEMGILSRLAIIASFRGQLVRTDNKPPESGIMEPVSIAPLKITVKTVFETLGADEVIPSAAMSFIASMLLTPIIFPIMAGLSATLFPQSFDAAPSLMYGLLLVLPGLGCWLAYRGYMAQASRTRTALYLGIGMNIAYGASLIFGIVTLAK
jgi:hypothetical protein